MAVCKVFNLNLRLNSNDYNITGMKKIAITLFTLIASATLFAQENKDGKMQGDVLYLNNGVMLKKGSVLKLNGPLGEDARFKYVYHAPDNLFDDMTLNLTKPAEPYYATKDVTVRKIRFVEDKKNKDNGKWVVRFRTDKKEDFVCNIAEAISSGEISAMQSSFIEPQPVSVRSEPQAIVPVQTELVKSAVSESSEPVKSTSSPAFSVADELLKLKKLMDEGIITKEEFEAQKKKLLEM